MSKETLNQLEQDNNSLEDPACKQLAKQTEIDPDKLVAAGKSLINLGLNLGLGVVLSILYLIPFSTGLIKIENLEGFKSVSYCFGLILFTLFILSIFAISNAGEALKSSQTKK